MARNKYIYHHFVNGVETTKEDFIKHLEKVCVRCDTNDDNPFLNISYLDTDLVRRRYDYFKCHSRTTVHYVGKKLSLQIKRELKNKEEN